MKYTREEILKGAFGEFISRGYDCTTISDLQIKLNMSRGGMYRHFRNKEDLFRAVLDEYVFEYFNRMTYDFSQDIRTLELIKLRNKRQKQLIDKLISSGATYSTFLNFTALLIQAAKYYPDFIKKFRKIQKQIRDGWCIALQNSINAGEVRGDINVDILSRLFTNININDSRNESLAGVSFPEAMKREAKEKGRILLYLYDMIKTL